MIFTRTQRTEPTRSNPIHQRNCVRWSKTTYHNKRLLNKLSGGDTRTVISNARSWSNRCACKYSIETISLEVNPQIRLRTREIGCSRATFGDRNNIAKTVGIQVDQVRTVDCAKQVRTNHDRNFAGAGNCAGVLRRGCAETREGVIVPSDRLVGERLGAVEGDNIIAVKFSGDQACSAWIDSNKVTPIPCQRRQFVETGRDAGELLANGH